MRNSPDVRHQQNTRQQKQSNKQEILREGGNIKRRA